MEYTKIVKSQLTKEQRIELKKLLFQYGSRLAEMNQVDLYNESVDHINELYDLLDKYSTDVEQ